MAEETGMSRRRVLVGAAWTAPVVLIAGAIPAAAASTDRGALVCSSVTSVSTTGPAFLIGATVSHAIAANAPVSAVRLGLGVQADRVSSSAVATITVGASAWTFQTKETVVVSGTTAYIFWYTLNTGTLSGGAAAPSLRIRIPATGTTSVAGQGAGARATGTSLSATVTAPDVIVTTT